jgi:phosphoribosylglycinamide formyltransferase-1
MTKLAVLVSGTGTILEAIMESGIEVSLVVADRQCRGLEIASTANIPIQLVMRSSFDQSFERESYSHKIVEVLQQCHIDLIAMAGFMTVLGKPVFDAYDGSIINTHPSLLPKFRGGHAVQDTLDAGELLSGCTIHIATLELDAGPILAQKAVPVLPDDTVRSLQERIKQVERRLYPKTLKSLIQKANMA